MTSTILPKEITGAAILLGVLVRREEIEGGDDLSANRRNRVVRYDEDKIIAANVPDESVFAARSLDDVVQQLGKDADYAIAFVVAISIVEFLEVVEVGISNGEVVGERQSPANLGLDRRSPGEACRRVHDQVPFRAN